MSDLVVRPIRFTDNIEGMRVFLAALGLRPRIEAERGAWVDMVAGAGMVALHSARQSDRQAPSGLTALGFETDDVQALADRLTALGLAGVQGYDEAYGRVLRCTDPRGDVIVIDARSDDLYGFREHDTAGVNRDVRVVAVRFSNPLGPYGGFLEALGLERRGEANPYFVPYVSGSGAHGVVALHHERTDGPFDAESGAVDLSFETGEPLEQVGERLAAKGFPTEMRAESFGSVLDTVDADDQPVEIHQAPEEVA